MAGEKEPCFRCKLQTNDSGADCEWRERCCYQRRVQNQTERSVPLAGCFSQWRPGGSGTGAGTAARFTVACSVRRPRRAQPSKRRSAK